MKIWYLLLNRKFSGVIVKFFNNIRVLFMSCMVNECSLETMVDVLINIEIFKRKLEEVEIWDKVLWKLVEHNPIFFYNRVSTTHCIVRTTFYLVYVRAILVFWTYDIVSNLYLYKQLIIAFFRLSFSPVPPSTLNVRLGF